MKAARRPVNMRSGGKEGWKRSWVGPNRKFRVDISTREGNDGVGEAPEPTREEP